VFTTKCTSFLILIGLLAISCGPPPIVYEKDLDNHDYVVARVDTLFEVTLPQLYDSIKNSDLLPLGGVLTSSDARLILDSMLCDTLAGLAAATVKLDEHYNDHRMYRMRYHSALIWAFLEQEVYQKVSFDSAEVFEFYHNRPDLYSIEEQVMLSHILISPIGLKFGRDSLHFRPLEQAQFDVELKEYAHQIRRLTDVGMSFDEVAREYSHDQFTGRSGGYVGWTERGIYLHPFDSVAFSLPEGEVSQPYQDPDGWHIILVSRHMAEGIPPFDSMGYRVATEDLKNTIANNIGAPLMDSLRNLPMEIVYNEAILDTNVYLVERPVWAAIVNSTDTLDFNDLRIHEETWRSNNRIDNTTVEMKKEMIAALADKILMIQSARAFGCETLPEVVETEAYLRHVYSKSVYETDRYDHTWQPDDSLVRQYYDEHIDRFTIEKPMEIQHIIAEDSSFAEFLRDQAMAGTDFLDLAREYYPGEPEIRAELANLGRVGPGEVPDELYNAALMTPVGDVSSPVKTEFGYHVVKVVSRRNAIDFSRASMGIVPILRRQHDHVVFEQYRDRLYDRFQVEFTGKLRPLHFKPLEYRSSKP
jgi:hypothetical protein